MYNFWVIYWSNRYKLHQNAFRSLDHDHSSVSVINLIIIHVGFFFLFRLYVDGTLVFFSDAKLKSFQSLYFLFNFIWLTKTEAMPSYQLNGPNFCMVKAMDIEKSRQGHHFSTKCRDACIEIQLWAKLFFPFGKFECYDKKFILFMSCFRFLFLLLFDIPLLISHFHCNFPKK